MQNFFYPSSAASANPSVGPNGVIAPTSTTQVGGVNPSGNLEPVNVDANGDLIVSPLSSSSTVTVVQPTGSLLHATIDASALPTGASTSSLQTSGNASLSSIVTNTTGLALASQFPTTIGQKVAASSLSVILASDQVLPLPTGAATASLQTSGNASLTSIDSKTPALGQALAAASVPVVLTASQLSTLTPLTSVSVNNFPATQPVSGTVAVSAIAGALPAGANALGSVSVSNFPATQPVSGTVSISGSVAVTGTFFQATQPVSLTTLPALTAGTAIIGKVGIDQTTPGTTNGVQVNAALPAGTNVIGKVQQSTPTALTVTQAAITVGTSAVRLTVSGSAPSSTRVVLVATPDTASTATFYIGSATVTNSGATRGVEIVAGQSFIANNDAGDYYIVSSAATQTVTVLEQA